MPTPPQIVFKKKRHPPPMGQMMVNGARTQPRTRRATLVVWSVRALRKGAVLARGVSVGASRGSLLMRPWPLGLGGKGKME